MRVTIFTNFNTALNPYILLFKQALENEGLNVCLERNLNLNWLIAKGKSCDCIHLHWLNFAYAPRKNSKSEFYERFIHNRLIKMILDFICLIEFVLTFFIVKLTGKIIVFTVHDLHDFGEKSLRRKFQIEIARNIVFWFSDSIHVHNHYTRKLVETKYRRRIGIYVVPHGNYIRYYTNKISRVEARRLLGLPKDVFVYLFLGLLRPYKGLRDLFDAFKELDCPQARLLVVGRIFGVKNYASRLTDLSRTDSRITLVPKFIPDDAIQIYLNACDIFVLPYKDITTSGAVALALSFGKPIIAPAIASFPEVISVDTGILYDSSQPNALTSALKTAITSSYSKSTIFNYASKFDWNKLGFNLAHLYQKRFAKRSIIRRFLRTIY